MVNTETLKRAEQWGAKMLFVERIAARAFVQMAQSRYETLKEFSREDWREKGHISPSVCAKSHLA